MMKRCTLGAVLLVVGVLLPMALEAREGRSGWDGEGKAECLMKIIDMLKLEQDERLARLEQEAPEFAPDLSYPNFEKFGMVQGGEKSIREKFLKGRISKAQRTAFIQQVAKDLQDNQTRLYAAEKMAAPGWKPNQQNVKKSEKEFTAEVFGQHVTAVKLGVILDNSPSMAPYMAVLRKEIGSKFPYCYFVEVDGSEITQLGSRLSRPVGRNLDLEYWENMEASWFFADPGPGQNPFLPHWHSPERLVWNESSYHEWYGLCRSNFSALLAMSNLLEVDTVYWFSDFQDEASPRLRRTLVRILGAKKVKLYLHSHDKRPHVDLVKYARSSGGDYQREKIKLDQ